MPTYVFKCPKCGFQMERLLSIMEFSTTPNPVCVTDGCDGQQTMKTVIQPTAFALKGTGWTPKHY